MHRDPVDVFASAANMADTTYWYSFLNVPTDDEILDFIISQYRIMMDQYIRDRELIPKGNLVEVAFADLAKEPEVRARSSNTCSHHVGLFCSCARVVNIVLRRPSAQYTTH